MILVGFNHCFSSFIVLQYSSANYPGRSLAKSNFLASLFSLVNSSDAVVRLILFTIHSHKPEYMSAS